MKQVGNMLRKLDFVGIELKPTIGGSSRIKSVFGAFLSLIMCVCSVFGFTYFGLKIIRKNEPIMNNIHNRTDNATSSVKQNPFTLGAYDSYGRILHKDPEFFRSVEIEVMMSQPRRDSEKSFVIDIYYGKMRLCTDDDLDPKFSEDMKVVGRDMSSALCTDVTSFKDPNGKKYEGEVVIRNTYPEMGSSYFIYKLKYCDETKDPGCRNYLRKIGRVMVIINMPNYYVDQSDYENPVKPDTSNVGFQISDKLSQAVYVYSQINELVTDSGLFLSQTSTEIFYKILKTTTSIGVFEEKQRVALQFTVSNDRLVNISQRRYLKIPELLANIGGLLKALLVIANLLSHTYSEYVCLVTITKIEAKHKKVVLKNNLVQKGNDANSSKNVIKLTNKSKKTVEIPSFIQYVVSLFKPREDFEMTRKNKLRFLELNYLIQKLTFIEEIRSDAKEQNYF